MRNQNRKLVALANPRVAKSKSVLAAFYFLWTSGFYVRTTKICKVLVRWTSEVKKTFFSLVKVNVNLMWKKSRRTSHHSSCYRRVQKSTLTSCDKFLPFDWNKEGTFTRRTREKLWKQQLIDVLYYCKVLSFSANIPRRSGSKTQASCK